MSLRDSSVLLPVCVTLVAGTFAAISHKALYENAAPSLCRPTATFRKPWFLTLAMFVGEALCLGVYMMNKWYGEERNKEKVKRWVYAVQHPREALAHSNERRSNSSSDGSSSNSSSNGDAAGGGGGGNTDDTAPLLKSGTTNASSSSSYQSIASSAPSLSLLKPPPSPLLPPPPRHPSRWWFLLFSLFDLSATVFGGFGLLYVTASANQMLRGSSVVFTALFSLLLIRVDLVAKHWAGILLVVVGEASVGVTAALRARYTDWEHDSESVNPNQVVYSWEVTSFGILLVLIGAAVNSIQNVLQEKMLKRKDVEEVHPLYLVGWEGIYGSLACLVILPILQLLPGSDCGSMENSLDSLYMLSSSPLLFFLVFGYTLSLSVMNWLLMLISKLLSAVHRNLVAAVRVVVVWMVSLSLFYVLTPHSQGEEADRFSLIQAVGFAFIIGGTMVYGMGNVERKAREEEQERRRQSVDLEAAAVAAMAAAAGEKEKEKGWKGEGEGEGYHV